MTGHNDPYKERKRTHSDATENAARHSREIGTYTIIGNSAETPAPSTRNSAVDYRIAASIGVTDVRVQ